LTQAAAPSPADIPGAPTPKSLILDIYGAHVRRLGGWLAVADLVILMSDLGVDGQAVRAAVSRMKRSGLLVAQSRGGVAGYALTAAALEILTDGDVRIFQSAKATSLSDGWVVAVFSVPEEARERRHRLRSQLIRLGFGQLSPGAWIAPMRMHLELGRRLARAGLAQHVSLFGGAYLGCTDLGEVVARAWDLPALQHRYARFTAVHRRIATSWSRRAPRSDEQAFVDDMGVLTAWRRLAYQDPNLPVELLPRRWGAEDARTLFSHLHSQLEPRAAAYVTAVVDRAR
jgi:phenylacetic acid degradation operon negative regulatory protein